MWTCNLSLEVVVSVEGISAIFTRLFVLMPENYQGMARYVISRTCVDAKDIASSSKGIALEHNKGEAVGSSCLKTEPPSDLEAKALFLYVQTHHNTRQRVQDFIHSATIGNIDSNIKFGKFSQRFAVFWAKQLHAHNVLQVFSLYYVQKIIRHDAIHLKHPKHDVHPHNRTTIARKAITGYTICSKDKTYKRKPPRLNSSSSFTFSIPLAQL